MFLKVFLCFCVFRVFVQIVYFLFLTKNSFRGIFVSYSRVSFSCENGEGKNWKTLNFRQKLLRLSHEKQLPMKQFICFSGIFTSNLVRSLPAKSAYFQFLKANSDSFSKICLLPSPCLSQPKTLFLSQPSKISSPITSKTSLRYVSTYFHS